MAASVGGLTSRSAGRLSLLARRLHKLPTTSAAYRAGVLSGGQVAAIVAQLDDDTVALFADHEDELVPYLAPLTVAGVARAMAAWKSRASPNRLSRPSRSAPAPVQDPGRPLRARRLPRPRGWSGGGRGPAHGRQRRRCRSHPATRRADALVDICRFFLDHQQSKSGGRHRPHVNVVVDLEALELGQGGRVVDGPPLDGATVARMLCDCALHRVVTSGRSAVIDDGVATRTIAAPLWSALVIRDEHCRFPGCDRPSQWCEGHHVVWVTHDGTTELANLVLVCARHHHRLHQPGWQAKLLPDATFEVTDPGGRVRATSPPRAEPAW